jgi:hypothetical protein
VLWQVTDNVLRPYEFSIGSNLRTPDCSSEHYQQFLANFSEALEDEGAQTIFGLCSYLGNDFKDQVKTIVGRASVDLKPSKVSFVRANLEAKRKKPKHRSRSERVKQKIVVTPYIRSNFAVFISSYIFPSCINYCSNFDTYACCIQKS